MKPLFDNRLLLVNFNLKETKKMNLKPHFALSGILFLLFSFSLINCQDSNPTTGNNPPSDHTVSFSSAKHKPGYLNASVNCVECHGADLKGGSSPVSCYDCHNKKWN